MAATQAGPSRVDYYPPVSFHFRVNFENLEGAQNIDINFQSVTGLDVQMETEPIKEGGVNGFEHTVPVRAKYSDLVLKRGILLPEQSGITRWCKRAFENFQFQPINVIVNLLDSEHNPLMIWKVVHALPKNWKLGEMNAEDGKILIETLELSYNYFVFQKP